jgi:hypothetical protein
LTPSARFQLPDGWATPEVVEDAIVADDVPMHRAGLSTVGVDGEEVCGSAADVRVPTALRAALRGPRRRGPRRGEPRRGTLDRAWFELLERISGHEALRDRRPSYEVRSEAGEARGTWSRSDVFPESDAPHRWTYARSNGVALHVDWTTACRRASWELAERDRVLRAWHGELVPEHIEPSLASREGTGAKTYDWQAYSFPEPDPAGFSRDVHVVGVFGFPKCDDAPFLLGLAGRPDRPSAITAATSEALQLLAFLWGEPLPEAGAAAGVAGPLQHLDRYQVRGAHEAVRRWLAGAHVEFRLARPVLHTRPPDEHDEPDGGAGFVDLTPEWLPRPLRVVKAVCRRATPLLFGDSPLVAHLPPELRLHPIP